MDTNGKILKELVGERAFMEIQFGLLEGIKLLLLN